MCKCKVFGCMCTNVGYPLMTTLRGRFVKSGMMLMCMMISRTMMYVCDDKHNGRHKKK